MVIKEFHPHPDTFLSLLKALELGILADITVSIKGKLLEGRLVAAHPERMSFSFLVEHERSQ